MGQGKIYETAKICERTKLTMDEDTVIGDYVFVSCASLTMLKGAQINRFTEVGGRGRVVMGRHVTVGSHCSLLTSTDTPWGYMNDQKPEDERQVRTGDIMLSDNVFIGQHSTIMPGITIGEGSVIGAYSYITTDVPAWRIVHPPKLRPISVFRRLADGITMPNYPDELKKLAEEEIRREGK
jgi:acetyltransferase-like isoleucine patch superfamily enzyme